MSLSNSGFCDDVVFIYLGYVAMIYVTVVLVQGILASPWIRSCVYCVDWVFIFSEVVA